MYTDRKNMIIGDAEPIDLSNRAGVEVFPSSFDSLDKVSKIKVIEKDDAENTENEKIQRQQYSFLTDDIFLSIYDNVWDKLLYSVKNKMNIYRKKFKHYQLCKVRCSDELYELINRID